MNKVDIHDLRTFTVTFIIFLQISVEIQSWVWEEKIPVGKICRQQEITIQNKSSQI